MPNETKTESTRALTLDLAQFLTEAQENALRSKILPNDREKLEKEFESIKDALLASIVSRLQKDANDRIFSQNKQGYLNTLLNWYRSTISEAEVIQKQAFTRIEEIRNVVTPAQRKALMESLKDALLRGKLKLDDDTETAFITTCVTMRVDPKDVR